MNYQLPPHVRMCHTVRGVVFLDLKRNRYTGLSPSASASVLAMLAPCATTTDRARASGVDIPELTRQLLDAGLIEARTQWGPDTEVPAVPAGALSYLQLVCGGDLGTPHPIRFLRAWIWARRAMKRQLWDVLSDLIRLRARCEEAPSAQQVASLAASFHRLRPFAFTARDQCLLHALALLHYLAACGVAATWLIGVQTHPWGAHSWVQWNDVVLDAAPEQTLPFTPILIA